MTGTIGGPGRAGADRPETAGAPPEVRVKICGLRREPDARLAAELGAAFLGFVFAPSPRQADPSEIAAWLAGLRRDHPGTLGVGVFVDPPPGEAERVAGGLGLDLVQVHRATRRPPVHGVRWIEAGGPDDLPLAGSRPAAAGRSPAPAPYAWLVDTVSAEQAGGTGRVFDWSLLPAPREYRLFLAGGLDPENVGRAIGSVRPWAVDASSRLESAPGEKDPVRLSAFFRAVREAARLRPADPVG